MGSGRMGIDGGVGAGEALHRNRLIIINIVRPTDYCCDIIFARLSKAPTLQISLQQRVLSSIEKSLSNCCALFPIVGLLTSN